MFTLTENEARLAIYEHAKLISYGTVDLILKNLQQDSDRSVELHTPKCKLSTNSIGGYYIDSNDLHNYGKLYIFDSLELLESYWEYLLEVCDFAEQYINYLKVGYLKYKESIE